MASLKIQCQLLLAILLLIPLNFFAQNSASTTSSNNNRTTLLGHPHRPHLHRCPARCSCAHSAVICTGLGLSQVPDHIPPDTTRLDLQENRLQTARAKDFAGLGELRVLLLGNNLLDSIEPGAFDALPKLERLRLDRNRLRTIPEALFAQNRLLKRLDLSENSLWTLSTEQLAGPEQLLSLQLDHNQLQCLDSLALSRWPTLESLSLSSNALTTMPELSLASLPALRNLRLADNPWHCDCRLRWLKRLTVASQIRCHRPPLLYGRSLDSVSTKQLKCSGLEKRASDGGGQKRACRDVDSCPAGCSCTEAGGPDSLVVDCHDRQLRAVPQRLPQNTVELRLEQNRITRLDNHTFAHVPRLRRLDLSKNAIEQVDAQAFAGLTRLGSLMLFANNLTDLPDRLFHGLSSLQVLLLNGNRLQCLRAGLFRGLDQLRLLSLYDNQLRAIAEPALAPLISQSLQTLHLAKNPLICDCNLAWLARLLHRHPIETSGARCHSPARIARRRIGALSPDRLKCLDSEQLVTEGAGQCRVDHECPEQCQCQGSTVNCSHRQLTAVPLAIPQFATILNLSNNRIQELAPPGPLPNLRSLDLSANAIHSFGFHSLAGLDALRQLDLRNNSISRLSFSSSVGQLTMANSLETLLLDGNSLSCLSLAQLPALRSLSLRQSPRLISLASVQHLTSIQLDSTGQWLCDCQLRQLVRLLNKMTGNQNGTEPGTGPGPKCAAPARLRGKLLAELDDRELGCSAEETSADQQEEISSHCSPEGTFCPRGCLCSGTSASQLSPSLIVRCSNRSLTRLPWGIPADTAELLLDNNRIERLSPEQFTGLDQLTKLDLSHNRLRHVPARAFASLPVLASLILANNQIGCLDPSAFAGLGRLRLLSLHGNQLAQLPESAFAPLLANLSHVTLGANPLWCDCSMNWAVRWLRSKFVEPGIARCDGPPQRRQQLLLSAEPLADCSTASPPDWVLAKCQPCLLRPCLHSAACRPLPDGQFSCDCPPGWHGQLCELSVNACFGQPCQNGATCRTSGGLEEQGRFRCECAAGFIGQRCEQTMADGCNGQCQNGGKCRHGSNGLINCDCASGWLGEHCELNATSSSSSAAVSIDLEEALRNCSPGDGECPDLEKPPANLVEYEQHRALLSRAERAHPEGGNYQKPPAGEGNSSIKFDFASKIPASPSSNSAEQHKKQSTTTTTTLSVVGLNRAGAFLSLGQWTAKSDGQRQLELKFRTEQRGGLLLWLGQPAANAAAEEATSEAFLLLELVQGRVRAAVQLGPGHWPPSQLFSLSPVNDGRVHRLRLRLQGQRLFLTLDQLPIQTILNSGPQPQFPAGPLQLFLGGMPAELARRALVQLQLSDPSSIRGCFWDIRLDGAAEPMDLTEHIVAPANLSTSSHDFHCPLLECEGEECSAEEEEEPQQAKSSGSRKRRRCARERPKASGGHFWLDPEGKCRSVHPLPSCAGQCQQQMLLSPTEELPKCCAPVARKKRRIRLRCLDGSERWTVAEVPRRCGCAGGEDCSVELR